MLKEKNHRLRLNIRRLHSGKCQIKFYATIRQKKEIYGYVLAEAEDTLKQVVMKIRDHLELLEKVDSYQHFNLFRIGRVSKRDDNILIFKK